MNFKKTKIDKIRANSLIKASEEAINTAKSIPIENTTIKTIFRELYEGLRQYCQAIGYLKGYKLDTHEIITIFLKEELNEESLSLKFERYRDLRNKINYYGHDVSSETVKETLIEIPKMIRELSKYTKD